MNMAYTLLFISKIDYKGRISLRKNTIEFLKLKKGAKIAILAQGKTLKMVKLEDILKKGVGYTRKEKGKGKYTMVSDR